MFGPIECHHLVSFYRKKGGFDPERMILKKSHVRPVNLQLDLPESFRSLLWLEMRHSISGAARRGQSPNLDYTSEITAAGVYSLEVLLRRGLGYRIIFNMGGKVYNPEDPSTLPDVVIVVTDFTAQSEIDRLLVSKEHWGVPLEDQVQFFERLSGSGVVEVTYTCEGVVITRDGKVELEFFHFDKLLSPEQLKAYSCYSPVLGDLVSIIDHSDKGEPFSHVTADLESSLPLIVTRISGMVERIAEGSKHASEHDSRLTVTSKLQAAAQMLVDHVLNPIRHLDDNVSDACGLGMLLLSGFDHIVHNPLDLRAKVSDLLAQVLEVAENISVEYSKCLNSHFDTLISKDRDEVAAFFCMMGNSKIDAMLLALIKCSKLAKTKLSRLEIHSSRLNTTANHQVQVRNHKVQVSMSNIPEPSAVKFPLPVFLLPGGRPVVESNSSRPPSSDHSSDTERLPIKDNVEDANPQVKKHGGALSVSKLRELNPIDGEWMEYRYEITPLKHDRVLVSAGNLLHLPKLMVELKKLQALKDWKKSGISIDSVWEQASEIVKPPPLSEPSELILAMIENTSSTSVTTLSLQHRCVGNAFDDDYFQLVLSHLSLHSPQDWISRVVMEEHEIQTESQEILCAVYHSQMSRLIFVCTKNFRIGYRLMCYKLDFPAKKLEPLCNSTRETEFSRQDYQTKRCYWLEKKGRVFFYSVQSSPEIKLLVICYHKNRFVALGNRERTLAAGYGSIAVGRRKDPQSTGTVQHVLVRSRPVCCLFTPHF